MAICPTAVCCRTRRSRPSGQRSEDIAAGRLTHVPSRYIQFEDQFRDGKKTTDPRIDMIRKMVYLCYHDDLFEAAAKNPAIVDVIEDSARPRYQVLCRSADDEAPLFTAP